MSGEGGFNPLDPDGWGNLVWTLVIFGLSLPLILKIVFKPIVAALADRDTAANTAVTEAKAARDGAESARDELEKRLAEASEEVTAMLSQARADAEARSRTILAEAEERAAGQIDRAQAEISAAKEQAMAEIRAEVVDLALGAAGAVVGRSFAEGDDRRLVEDLVRQVEAN